jgi:hypothetical protein
MTPLTYCEFIRPIATMIRRVHVFALLLASFVCMADAQQPKVVTLTIIVMDQTRWSIPLAHIVATQKATGEQFRTESGPTGYANLQLRPGVYDLRVEAKSFMASVENGVEVTGPLQKTSS